MKQENPLEELLEARRAAVAARDKVYSLSREGVHELARLMAKSDLPEQFKTPGALLSMYDDLIKSIDKAIQTLKSSTNEGECNAD